MGPAPFENVCKQRFKLGESDAAGNAFAAALGQAHFQKRGGQIHRTEPRRAGNNPAFQILIQTFHDRLGPAGGNNTESAQDEAPFSLAKQ
ncbi:hypothetical protein CLOM621_07471 [Clostridium sp. M62/1]|nr:hypothetical protein CLOM621_07471 [Clostridium sp. M62/1]